MSISCQGSNHRFILTPDVTSSSIIICKVRSPNVILEPQRRELNVNDYTEVKHLLTYLFAYLFFSLYYQDFGIYTKPNVLLATGLSVLRDRIDCVSHDTVLKLT